MYFLKTWAKSIFSPSYLRKLFLESIIQLTLAGETCHGNAKAKWLKPGTQHSVETRALQAGVLSKTGITAATSYSSPSKLTQATQGDKIN